MDSVGLLKLPDTRATSKHYYIKDRLMIRLGMSREEDLVWLHYFEKIIQLQ